MTKEEYERELSKWRETWKVFGWDAEMTTTPPSIPDAAVLKMREGRSAWFKAHPPTTTVPRPSEDLMEADRAGLAAVLPLLTEWTDQIVVDHQMLMVEREKLLAVAREADKIKEKPYGDGLRAALADPAVAEMLKHADKNQG